MNRNNFKNVPVLVTGATGFIGSYLVRALIKKGALVSIIKRPSSSLWRLNDLTNKIRILETDISKISSLRSSLKDCKPKIVFHLAASVNRGLLEYSVNQNIKTNLIGTLNLLGLFTKNDVKCFVNVGTCDEYGANTPPFHEDLREMPFSPYAATKVAVTHYCQMVFRTEHFPVVTLRPFLTYGPYQTGDYLIPYVIDRCLRSLPIRTTKGEQTKEFHYVTDIVDGILLAAITEKAIGEVIDLGTGTEHKVKEVLELIVKLTGYLLPVSSGDLPYRESENRRFYCYGNKARKILNWQPKISLEEGIVKTIKWQKNFLKQNQNQQ